MLKRLANKTRYLTLEAALREQQEEESAKGTGGENPPNFATADKMALNLERQLLKLTVTVKTRRTAKLWGLKVCI